VRESYIEKRVCAYAVLLGWVHYKFSSPGNRGVPDRILLRKGRIIFIEFKATGKKPTKLQYYIHKIIRKLGFKVYVVDDIEAGKMLLDEIS